MVSPVICDACYEADDVCQRDGPCVRRDGLTFLAGEAEGVVLFAALGTEHPLTAWRALEERIFCRVAQVRI